MQLLVHVSVGHMSQVCDRINTGQPLARRIKVWTSTRFLALIPLPSAINPPSLPPKL